MAEDGDRGRHAEAVLIPCFLQPITGEQHAPERLTQGQPTKQKSRLKPLKRPRRGSHAPSLLTGDFVGRVKELTIAADSSIVFRKVEPGHVVRVAAEPGSTRMTVRKWRRRFAEEGLAGLADHDRSGRSVAEPALTD